MVHLIDVTMHFGGQELFRNLNWHIRRRDRVGLVGANGSGKTTLLKIISGQIDPSAGQIRRGKGTTFGYLPQEGLELAGRSVLAEASSALPDIVSIQAEMTSIHEQLENDSRREELLRRYGELQHRFEALDGFRAEAEVTKVLCGLGFLTSHLHRPTETFSAGWQTRIGLAKLLLRRPSLLLLDEPTNHLDLDSLIWLEEYLQGYDGGVVIVSHDRAFLDRMVRRIAMLERHVLKEYHGNYSEFERQRERELTLSRQAYQQQQREIQRLQRFIDGFRSDKRRAAQVQSRMKYLDKMERLEPPPPESRTVRFSFPSGQRSGRMVVELSNVRKRYGTQDVLAGVNLTIERGDRIALLGINGAGKSTLSRIIAGVEEPSAGERRVGHHVEVAYFDEQQAEKLQELHSVYDEVLHATPFAAVPTLRSLLGAFLFRGDDVEKKVAVLSGGEKSRLALVKMLFGGANFLVLDEPTNHLDMQTKDVLKAALQKFPGSFLIVSHDRHFLWGLVNKVVVMRDGCLTMYPGTFEEYCQAKVHASDSDSPRGSPPSPREPQRGKTLFQQHKAARAHRQRQARRIADLERRIHQLEARKAAVEAILRPSTVLADYQRAGPLMMEVHELAEEIDRCYRAWAELIKEAEEKEREA